MRRGWLNPAMRRGQPCVTAGRVFLCVRGLSYTYVGLKKCLAQNPHKEQYVFFRDTHRENFPLSFDI